MTQPIAGIARSSCPLCGELTHVPIQRMLFRSWNDMQQRASYTSDVRKLARHFANAPECGPKFVYEYFREGAAALGVNV